MKTTYRPRFKTLTTDKSIRVGSFFRIPASGSIACALKVRGKEVTYCTAYQIRRCLREWKKAESN